MKLGHTSPHRKFRARYITDVSVRCKSISIIEDKTGKYLNDLRVSILKIHKKLTTKKKTDKLTTLKLGTPICQKTL